MRMELLSVAEPPSARRWPLSEGSDDQEALKASVYLTNGRTCLILKPFGFSLCCGVFFSTRLVNVDGICVIYLDIYHVFSLFLWDI